MPSPQQESTDMEQSLPAKSNDITILAEALPAETSDVKIKEEPQETVGVFGHEPLIDPATAGNQFQLSPEKEDGFQKWLKDGDRMAAEEQEAKQRVNDKKAQPKKPAAKKVVRKPAKSQQAQAEEKMVDDRLPSQHPWTRKFRDSLKAGKPKMIYYLGAVRILSRMELIVAID
ncbi:hypothetical protein FSPOR_7161 [Fusarium sporotrichioides]|uniref:Uncharacterized protein n=1 Tax=Fusarium sporotrichioides TaxID=5514 RepID=A0A395RZG0_FUSSP|nr:hypothetical protein FSPOR_7161 [Fusarium sporotrichioides]